MHDSLNERPALPGPAPDVPDSDVSKRDVPNPDVPDPEIIDPEIIDAEFTDASPPPPDGGAPVVIRGEHRRESDAVVEAMKSDTRQNLLLTLVRDGPGSVTTLAHRLGICNAQVSDHLSTLKLTGLVHYEKKGREKWYYAIPGLVRCERKDGLIHLHVNKPSGNGITLRFVDEGAGKQSVTPGVAGI